MLESAACWVDEKSWKKKLMRPECIHENWRRLYMKNKWQQLPTSSWPVQTILRGKNIKTFFFQFPEYQIYVKTCTVGASISRKQHLLCLFRGDSTTFMSVETYSDITPKLIKELCCRKPKDSVSVSWQNNGMMERLSSLKFINTASNARWHPVQRVRSAKDGAVHSLGTITVNFRQGQKRTQSKLNVWEWC